MIQGDGGNAKWARVLMVEGGPQTDYTNLGQCQGMNTPNPITIQSCVGIQPNTTQLNFAFIRDVIFPYFLTSEGRPM